MAKLYGVIIKDLGDNRENICSSIYELSPFRNDDYPQELKQKILDIIHRKISSLPALLFFSESRNEMRLSIDQLQKLGCCVEIVDGTFDELNARFRESINFDIFSVFDYFRVFMSGWYDVGNVTDCMTLEEHHSDNYTDYPIYRRNFNIPLNEQILFTRDTSSWDNRDEGLILTDKAIYFLPKEDEDLKKYRWTEITRVEYKEYSFYFSIYECSSIEISKKYFFKGISNERLQEYVGPSLAFHLSMMSHLAGDPIYKEIYALENDEKYDEAITKLDELNNFYNLNNEALFHLFKGRILVKKEWSIDDDGDENRFNQINKELLKACELSDDADYVSICDYWRAYNYKIYGDYFNARNLFISAMAASSEEMKEDAMEQFKDLESNLLKDNWNNYTTLYPYKERKFIMPIKDGQIAGCWKGDIDTFRISNIPSCIKFPEGHPIAGELYIAHPYNTSVYVPYEDSNDIFFLDKIYELCYLLQCLGAESISITAIKGKNVSELNNSNTIADINANVKNVSLSGSVSRDLSGELDTISNIQRTIINKYDPIKSPYVPEGLIWFPEQTKWQRLVDGRINGNQLEFSEFVSTSDTKFVTNSERTSIKASAEYLWNKIDGSADKKSESQFKETVETQWKVEVKFKSVKEFDNVEPVKQVLPQISTYTDTEQEYVDNLKEFLKDDSEITPRERKMLDKIRDKLGISEDRGKELESFLCPQLSSYNGKVNLASLVVKNGEKTSHYSKKNLTVWIMTGIILALVAALLIIIL